MIETRLDPQEEQRYARLRRMGQKLHIPIPEAFWTLEVFDKNGKLIQKHHQRSHSWTRNAYNMMFSQLACALPADATFEAGKLSQKVTDGTIYSGDYPFGMYYPRSGGAPYCYMFDTNFGYRASAAVDDYGILVGSGTNAESFEDYVLQTPIAEGSGAGQLNHVQSEAQNVSYSDTTFKSELARYFNNNSGGDVSVNEVALVCKTGRVSMPSVQVYVLMCRDKLASTVTVPDTGQLKVTYTIQLTYPA